MTKLDNSNIIKVLGQTVDYPDQYDPSILVREPRSNNRQHLDIHEGDLPFVGYDTWNAWEASTLTANGMPVTGVLKIVYPCDSTYIVESKSIKLYLNSFNMFRNGSSREKAVDDMVNTIKKDLSELLETNVQASFILEGARTSELYHAYDSLEHSLVSDDYCDNTNFTVYEETPSLLKPCEPYGKYGRMAYWKSGLLKSNCRVTNQPDWGDVYIHIVGDTHVTPESLLEYIVSFRNECHFHEEICETMYKRLNDLLKPEDLAVTCLYARRGGIDINPIRASRECLITRDLIDPAVEHHKTQKQ
jgi:7-cyano-7-deazaguanine reductase